MSERTVAIIQPVFLPYRLSIETAITQAGFDIIRERQIEFHPDDENLRELFGDEAAALTGGPVWVYVLEKENAVEELLVLSGDQDPAVARKNSPNSLRALYGESLQDNVVYAAPDIEMAEIQINSIFVSSPLFPSADEAELYDDGTVPVLADTGLHNRDQSQESSYGSQGIAPRVDSNGKVQFRARPIPSTTAVPSIQPRMSRASALRAGLADVQSGSPKPRAPLSKEEMARTFANVPGHKRSVSIAVASTAPPTIAPRATRASMLRTGQADVAPPRLRAATTNTTSETPGYKRNLKLVVASTAPPAIAPRQTRASALRTGQPAPRRRPSTAAGSTTRPKTEGTFVGVPGHKRAESIAVASTLPPVAPPRSNRSAELRARKKSEENKSPMGLSRRGSTILSATSATRSTSTSAAGDSRTRTISVTSSNQSSMNKSHPAPQRGRAGVPDNAGPPPSSYRGPRASSSSPVRSESRPGTSQSRPSSVASIRRAPSIEPKTNRAAMLRARAGTPLAGPKYVWV